MSHALVFLCKKDLPKQVAAKPKRKSKKRIKIENAVKDYLTTNKTYADICKEHNVSMGALSENINKLKNK